jgi:hypothetical protein
MGNSARRLSDAADLGERGADVEETLHEILVSELNRRDVDGDSHRRQAMMMAMLAVPDRLFQDAASPPWSRAAGIRNVPVCADCLAICNFRGECCPI